MKCSALKMHVFCYSESVGIGVKGVRGDRCPFPNPRFVSPHLGWAVQAFKALHRAGPLVTLEDLEGRGQCFTEVPLTVGAV